MSETMKDFEAELEASYKEHEEQQRRFASLSEEDAAEWEELLTMLNEQTVIEVKIKEAVKSGVVAYVNEVRAFIPASRLSLTYVENLEEYVGKHIKVRIIEADAQAKKLILSAKEILREEKEAEKQKVMDEMKVGSVVEGVVESLKPYGAFVRLSNGLSGLAHISQISQKRIKTPGEVLKEGQTVTAKLTQIKDGKLSLSMKALNDIMEEPVEEKEEKFDLPKAEAATTSMASLLAGFKFD